MKKKTHHNLMIQKVKSSEVQDSKAKTQPKKNLEKLKIKNLKLFPFEIIDYFIS